MVDESNPLTGLFDGQSRRSIMRKGAAGIAASGGLAGLGGTAAADSHGDDDNGGNGNGGGMPSIVEVLNYALTLEHLENNFYIQGLNDFSEEELENADVLCHRDEGINDHVYGRITTIQEHEAAHVNTISQVIRDLGGDPVEEACYDFGYETPSEFLQLAAVLETTGVSAYDGAVKFFDNDQLATAAATVATVEGRHSAYLNVLNQKSPFPRAFDNALSMEDVLEEVQPFIVECE